MNGIDDFKYFQITIKMGVKYVYYSQSMIG